MQIFITGGTGFIGKHLVDKLLHENHQLTVFIRSAYYIPLRTDEELSGTIKCISPNPVSNRQLRRQ